MLVSSRPMSHERSISPIFGQGVYDAPTAVRLVNYQRREPVPLTKAISRRTLSRWVQGYSYQAGGELHDAPPLWVPDYANDDGPVEVSFRDLVELRFVKAFRDLGLSLRAIRACLKAASEEVDDPRPFSTRRFRTDGRTIFLETTGRVADAELIDLRRRQRVFQAVVAPSLKDLEFDADHVSRWYPLGQADRSVVVDPGRSFGRPVLSEAGVPTEVIRDAVIIEGSLERVSRLYDCPLSAIKSALAFERRLAA
ncbi:MAG: hypothetical protein JO048_02215 [Methylobacteriaceae bacterium]|nr:hypothetical protein [Methylobacteriaceae bacterium]